MDCEGEPARVAGCAAKSGGQICANAGADGELAFAGIVLDRGVLLPITPIYKVDSPSSVAYHGRDN